MRTKFIIMRPGQPAEERTADLAHHPSYRELDTLIRPLLDGGELEHITVYVGGKPFLGKEAYRDMFVDDSGHAELLRYDAAKDRVVRDRLGKNLSRNEAATELYQRNMRMHEPEKEWNPGYFIVGNAVLFPDRRVWR